MTARVAARGRRGFALVFTLVALLVTGTLAGATIASGWRAMRTTRLAWNGERALLGADAALNEALVSWSAATIAAMPIGATIGASVTTADGGVAMVTLARPAPLVAVAEAELRSRTAGASEAAARRVVRVVALHPPDPPLAGTLTVLGDATIDPAAVVSGADDGAATDGCGPMRDTASVPALATISASAAHHVTAVTRLAAAIDTMLPRLASTIAVSPGGALPGAPAWTARAVTSADSSVTITLGGTSHHVGLLLVRGDLRVVGTLRVTGLLVVQGSIDAATGALEVTGAAIAHDVRNTGSIFGPTSRITWSPCTTRRALATVAHIARTPYALWSER